jgi:hypothetical protein
MNKANRITTMKDIEIGDIVEVAIEEGHVIFRYKLKVTDIEIGDENEIITYGEGITKEHEDLAEEFTHRIDWSNFYKIVG